MPRVVPSVVVNTIDLLWPRLKDDDINKTNSGEIAGVLDLVYQIPEELLPLDPVAYAELVIARAHIKHQLESWASAPRDPGWLGPVHGLNNRRPVNIIRDALANCDDSFPASGTTELAFIANNALREDLRIDISEVGHALASAEWKAATVLAGSAIEALLLWAIKQRTPAEIDAAKAAAVAPDRLTEKPDNNITRWNLEEYIEVAKELSIIKEKTAKAAHLARQFRNFIHPGASQRASQKCSRATALSAAAGMHHVIEELEKGTKP